MSNLIKLNSGVGLDEGRVLNMALCEGYSAPYPLDKGWAIELSFPSGIRTIRFISEQHLSSFCAEAEKAMWRGR